jgi:hypothetical protein
MIVKGLAQSFNLRIIHFVGKGLTRRRPNILFGRNGPTEDGYVEHFFLLRNRLVIIIPFRSKSE